MRKVSPEIQQLESESYRIVGMICSEAVPEERLAAAISELRQHTEAVFPGHPELFDRTYGRRFQRLRTRFRPARNLFA
jgi:hypothetical protein